MSRVVVRQLGKLRRGTADGSCSDRARLPQPVPLLASAPHRKGRYPLKICLSSELSLDFFSDQRCKFDRTRTRGGSACRQQLIGIFPPCQGRGAAWAPLPLSLSAHDQRPRDLASQIGRALLERPSWLTMGTCPTQREPYQRQTSGNTIRISAPGSCCQSKLRPAAAWKPKPPGL